MAALPPTPSPSSPSARATMRANRRRDTKPELAIRRALHRRGWRFRVDRAPLAEVRWKADLVFSRRRVAVFVDGCFWHGCPEHLDAPKSNVDYWRAKIEGNIARDSAHNEALEAAGWAVVRVWEHEPPEGAVRRIERVLLGRVPLPPGSARLKRLAARRAP